MPNAYDCARTYARYLRDFGMAEPGTVLRLEPHRGGIAVVCEPGPDPVVVSHVVGKRGSLFWEPVSHSTLFEDKDATYPWEAPDGWLSIPMPVFPEGIRAEAQDAVTLVFMPDDTGRATMFPDI